MNSQFEHDLFVSHSSADTPWVEALVKRLRLEIVGGHPLRVFYSGWDLDPGQNFVLGLQKGLQSSQFVAVVLSPDSIQSGWVDREWTTTVLSDPSGRAGRLIPLFLKDCDIPLLLRALQYIDFRQSSKFESSYQRLLRRIQGTTQAKDNPPAARFTRPALPLSVTVLRESTEPDNTTENLELNLFPLREYPQSWFRATAKGKSLRDIAAVLPKGTNHPFLLREGEVISFQDLSERTHPLTSMVLVHTAREESARQILVEEKARAWFIELLNRCITGFLANKGVRFDADHDRYYFLPPPEGEIREQEWSSPYRKSKRKVAEAIKSEGGALLRWEHRAAYIRFIDMDGMIYLNIDPTWYFTKDGREQFDHAMATALTVKRMYRESNGMVRNDVLFWVSFLSQEGHSIKLGTGSQPVIISKSPMTFSLPVGLDWDQPASQPRGGKTDDVREEIAEYQEGEEGL